MRAIVVFVAVLVLGGGALMNARVERAVLQPFTTFVTTVSATTLSAIGVRTVRDGNHLVAPGTGVRLYVGTDCSGAWAHLILLAAMLASPATWRERLRGLAVGQLVLFAANIVRVASLFVIAWKTPTLLHTAHVYVWQILIIGIALAVHAFWIESVADAGA